MAAIPDGALQGFPLDVPMAPAAALARIAEAMRRRPRRLFGVLRTETEWAGFVRDDTFEVWDRYRHAVHGYGRVKARRGGTRIEMRAELTTRAVVLSVLFFALFALAAAELGSTAPPGPLPPWLISAAGAVVIGVIFLVSMRQQKENLGRFVRTIFRD